jgi:hypothetical protein
MKYKSYAEYSSLGLSVVYGSFSFFTFLDKPPQSFRGSLFHPLPLLPRPGDVGIGAHQNPALLFARLFCLRTIEVLVALGSDLDSAFDC